MRNTSVREVLNTLFGIGLAVPIMTAVGMSTDVVGIMVILWVGLALRIVLFVQGFIERRDVPGEILGFACILTGIVLGSNLQASVPALVVYRRLVYWFVAG